MHFDALFTILLIYLLGWLGMQENAKAASTGSAGRADANYEASVDKEGPLESCGADELT